MAARANYRRMYFALFNTLTDAMKEMEKHNFGLAADILKQAQIDAEEIYLSAADKPEAQEAGGDE